MCNKIERKDVPEILYHYCNIDTFMKIIEKKTIRLSNIFKMNDYSEVKHVLKYLLPALKEKYRENPFPFEFKMIKNEQAFDQIVLCIEKEIDKVKYISYIASFSDSEDDLEQWNRYGDNGKGVAIGYDGKILYDIAEQCELWNVIIKVDYSVEEHKRYIKNTIVPRIFEAIRNNIGDDYKLLSCIISDMSAILLSAVKYKPKAYENEKEWRLCLHSHLTELFYPEDIKKCSENNQYDDMVLNKISFSNKLNAGICSYFDLFFGKFKYASSIIKKIIIGPKSIINESDLDLKVLLQVNNFNIGLPYIACSNIRKSEIPYT